MNRIAALLVCLFAAVVSAPSIAGDSSNGKLAAGEQHACAIRSGGVVCWGRAQYGQLGEQNLYANGARAEASWVPGLGVNSGATRVTAGARHSCAIVDGGVQCWGLNSFGQLGRQPVSNTPGKAEWVTGLGPGSGIQFIAAGAAHTCAGKNAPVQVRCWGRNQDGQLGVGDAAQSAVPKLVTLPYGFAGIAQLAAAESQTCVVGGANKAYCWGNNSSKQLTDDATLKLLAPTVSRWPVVLEIALGSMHTCVRDTAGSINCGGANQQGQNGTATSSFAVAKPAGLNGVIDGIAAGKEFSCAVDGNDVWCWGKAEYAQSGTVSLAPQTSAIKKFNGSSQIALGDEFGCAIWAADESIRCWGLNLYGQVGRPKAVSVPSAPLGIGFTTMPLSELKQLSLGGDHSCAVTQSNTGTSRLGCWGSNRQGQLPGVPATELDHIGWTPITLAPSQWVETAILVAAGDQHTCWATRTSDAATNEPVTGSLRCVGSDEYGQLGVQNANGELIDPFLNPILGVQSGYEEPYMISAGSNHTCLLYKGWMVENGEIYFADDVLTCWGDNSEGQINPALPTKVTHPARPLATSYNFSGVSAVDAGRGHTCALLDDQRVLCWGSNTYGQLGGPNFPQPGSAFVRRENADLTGITAISVGNDHACAIDFIGQLFCWGANGSGQLGIGTTADAYTAQKVPLAGVSKVSAGALHTCAVAKIADSAKEYCWGSNANGQVSNAPIAYYTAPTMSSPEWVEDLQVVEAGGRHSCKYIVKPLSAWGTVQCRGNGMNGRLGHSGVGYWPIPLYPVDEEYADADGDGLADPYDQCDNNPEPDCGIPPLLSDGFEAKS